MISPRCSSSVSVSSQESQSFPLWVSIYRWMGLRTEALVPLLVNWQTAVRRGKKVRHNHVALISWLRSCSQEIWSHSFRIGAKRGWCVLHSRAIKLLATKRPGVKTRTKLGISILLPLQVQKHTGSSMLPRHCVTLLFSHYSHAWIAWSWIILCAVLELCS